VHHIGPSVIFQRCDETSIQKRARSDVGKWSHQANDPGG